MKNLLLTLILFSNLSYAQPTKAWLSADLSIKFTSTISLKGSHMFGFNTAPSELKFTQSTAKINFTPGNLFNFSVGYSLTNSIKKETGNTKKNRYQGAIGLKSKWGITRIQNGIKFEIHDPKEKRYDYRLIYSFYIKTKSNLLIPKIKLTPFFNCQLFYNIGGNPISQYDLSGNYLGKFTPKGFHRIRFKTGFSITLIKHSK